jgi:poly(A) polymerase
LSPDEIEEKIRAAGRKPYLVGKRFGTIGFKVPLMVQDFTPGPTDAFSDFHQEYVYVEVTTYRTEKYDGMSRKPDVQFIQDLDLDLSRRDFTINAMVLNEDGTTYDPFGGRLDILAKQIKTVGLPKDRIQEDPLRMLRAARFASQLKFGVDPNFIGKMRQLGHTIEIVSKERWVAELDKMLMGAEPMRGIKVLMQSELMKYILPEVYLALSEDEAYQALADTFKEYPDMELNSRWGCLLSFIGHPYTYKEKNDKVTFVNHEVVRRQLTLGICARLKFPNERTDDLVKNKIVFKTIAY